MFSNQGRTASCFAAGFGRPDKPSWISDDLVEIGMLNRLPVLATLELRMFQYIPGRIDGLYH